jgi:hypothetical protein
MLAAVLKFIIGLSGNQAGFAITEHYTDGFDRLQERDSPRLASHSSIRLRSSRVVSPRGNGTASLGAYFSRCWRSRVALLLIAVLCEPDALFEIMEGVQNVEFMPV